MLTRPTLDQLRALRLEGMARALEEQHAHPAIEALTFDERLAQLIDRELLLRDGKRIERLLKAARIKVGGACLEDVDYRAGRGLERSHFAALGTCHWIRQAQNCLITGPTGSGKTGLACALTNAATAILDRLLHHSHVITIRRDSYRLRDKRLSGLLQKAAAPTSIASES